MKRELRNIVIALALAASAGAGCQGGKPTPYFQQPVDTEDTDTSTTDTEDTEDTDTTTTDTEDTDTTTTDTEDTDTDTADTEDTDTTTTDTETEDTDTATEGDANCPEILGKLDAATGLCWQVAPADEDLNRSSAIAYCEDLDAGGWTDWYLPAKADWITILSSCDLGVTLYDPPNGYCNSCADSPTCFSLLGGFGLGYHWMSNYYGTSGGRVSLTYGEVTTTTTAALLKVRCIRQAY